MRKKTTIVLALCALAAVAGRADDPEPPEDAKQALKKLRGKWTITRQLLSRGEDKVSPGRTLTFDGDKLTWSEPRGKGRGESVAKYRVKIDTKKRPYTIELVSEASKIGWVGIYKIEKGELYLAHPMTTREKGALVSVTPKDFKGADAPVYVMTREKDGK